MVVQVTYGSDDAPTQTSGSHCWGLDGLLADLCLDKEARNEADGLQSANASMQGADKKKHTLEEGEAEEAQHDTAGKLGQLEYELTPPESFAQLIKNAKGASDVVDAILQLQVCTAYHRPTQPRSCMTFSALKGGVEGRSFYLDGNQPHNDRGRLVRAD